MEYFLGIDTSNYKTSVAIVDSKGQIIENKQEFLQVKKGERGLRQSAALFQHVNNLPRLIEEVMANREVSSNIKAVAVSTRPRPVEGSYMPVFNGGYSAASIISTSLGVPLYEFSHQEGHIEAVKFYSDLKDFEKPFISFHFSGGTTESLLVNGSSIEIVGGSKDIAFGQVLDRIGVALGMEFPCGEEMDSIAINAKEIDHKLLPKIKVEDGYINLSGIETKGSRLVGTVNEETLIEGLFYRLGQAICNICADLKKKYQITEFLFAGGVSSSKYIRRFLSENLESDINIHFGQALLSTDNAVGIALLGGRKYGN